jgi:putative transcriptional regulator
MKRETVEQEVRVLLARTGFFSHDAKLFVSPVFDIVARRDASLVVVKCLLNGDSLTGGAAERMLQAAAMLRASPLVVAARSSKGKLEDGVIYLRHGAPMISLKTLHAFLVEGVPPVAYAGPGGYFVSLDSTALKHARQRRHLSLDAMAREVGLSRRAVQMYEDGMGAAIGAAERIERFFGESMTLPLDPFTYRAVSDAAPARPGHADDPFGNSVVRALEGMGYHVTPAARCPFDAVVERPGARLLSGIESAPSAVPGRARTLAAIAQVAETEAVMFVSKEIRGDSIGGTPVITRRELQRADSADEISEIIRQRRRAP